MDSIAKEGYIGKEEKEEMKWAEPKDQAFLGENLLTLQYVLDGIVKLRALPIVNELISEYPTIRGKTIENRIRTFIPF